MNEDLPVGSSIRFTIGARNGMKYPRVHVEDLSSGPWSLRLVEHQDDPTWNAYSRGPHNPPTFANLMRVHCGARYGGMSADTRVIHDGFTAEFGGMLSGPSWQAAIENFGTHRFTLKEPGTRPVMFFIYVGLGSQHEGGLTVELRKE